VSSLSLPGLLLGEVRPALAPLLALQLGMGPHRNRRRRQPRGSRGAAMNLADVKTPLAEAGHVVQHCGQRGRLASTSIGISTPS
jgi:hypothetical protein